MAQATGSVGKIFLPLGAGETISNQEEDLVGGVISLTIPAGHDAGAYGLIIEKITSDAGGANLITKSYSYTIDGDIVVVDGGTDKIYVTYDIWSVEALTLTEQCTFFGWELAEEAAMHDVTGFCDGAVVARSFISSLTDWKISAEMYQVNGDAGDITVFADAGGGKVTVTSAAHGLKNGRYVVIIGTTSYNGTFQISGVTTNTFDIVDTWVANDATGSWTSLPAIITYLDEALNDFRVIRAYEDAGGYWSGICFAPSTSLNVPLEEPVKRTIEFQGTSQNNCILGDYT